MYSPLSSPLPIPFDNCALTIRLTISGVGLETPRAVNEGSSTDKYSMSFKCHGCHNDGFCCSASLARGIDRGA